jgi:hypothetical protein
VPGNPQEQRPARGHRSPGTPAQLSSLATLNTAPHTRVSSQQRCSGANTRNAMGTNEPCAALERVMHVERCETSMETERARHPRARGDPAHGESLDSRVRGNDHRATRTFCQRSRVHNTL